MDRHEPIRSLSSSTVTTEPVKEGYKKRFSIRFFPGGIYPFVAKSYSSAFYLVPG
jgi:hypothetical protein